MAQQGPFGADDDGKTVILPNPGGRSPVHTPPVSQSPPPAQPAMPAVDLQLLNGASSANTLLSLASPLLSLSARLRVTVSYAGIEQLKQNLLKEVAEFETRALQSGLLPEQVKSASYVLCAFMDEVIQNTPWGVQSNWGHMCLLISVHREAWGGERFFQVLDYALKQASQNVQLVELCYVLLGFGFQGKYRVIANGLNELETVRAELYQAIQRIRGDFAVELSPHWQGQNTGKKSLAAQIPLWVISAVAASVLLLSYFAFLFALNASSDPVYKQLLGLAKEAAPQYADSPLPAAVPAAAKSLQRFIPLLSAEISQNMVEVADDKIIRIRNSFASGSDQIKPEFLPMLKKIAKELENGQDSIVVTGHTDDKAIVSAKFPSNWHLSVARAKNVLTILQSSANLSGSSRSEGRGDGEPLVSNDSAEHRALNRRVDILIK